MKKFKFWFLIRLMLALFMLYNVVLEAGIWTACALGIIYLMFEALAVGMRRHQEGLEMLDKRSKHEKKFKNEKTTN